MGGHSTIPWRPFHFFYSFLVTVRLFYSIPLPYSPLAISVLQWKSITHHHVYVGSNRGNSFRLVFALLTPHNVSCDAYKSSKRSRVRWECVFRLSCGCDWIVMNKTLRDGGDTGKVLLPYVALWNGRNIQPHSSSQWHRFFNVQPSSSPLSTLFSSPSSTYYMTTDKDYLMFH